MSVQVLHELVKAEFTHPRCPVCVVPMWHVKTVRTSGDTAFDRLHFKCMACDAEAIIPSLDN